MSADDNQIMTQSLSARGWRVWLGRGGKREARECSSEPQSSSLAILAASLAQMDCRCSSVCCSEVFFNLFWSNPLRVALSRPRPYLSGRSAWRASLFSSCARISAGAAEGKNTRKNSLPALVWQPALRPADRRANSRRRRSALRRHRAHLVVVVRATISSRRHHAERV